MRITGVACKKKRIIGGFLRIAGKNNWRVFEHNRLKPQDELLTGTQDKLSAVERSFPDT